MDDFISLTTCSIIFAQVIMNILMWWSAITLETQRRLIIDIVFQSHFEIARAVDSYDRILSSLLVVYVGSFTRLKQYLGIMEQATRSSLK